MNRATKKLKCVIAGLLQFAMIFLCMQTVDVSAASVRVIDREISVVCSDMLDTSESQTIVTEDPYADFGGGLQKNESYTYRYQFTIDQISYVSFRINSRVTEWNFTGHCDVYLGSTASDRSFPIATGKWVNGESPIDYTIALESGTYYLIVDTVVSDFASSGGNIPMQGGYLSIGVQAQELQRTGNVSGKTKTDAIPVVNGKISTGVISGVTAEGKFGVYTPAQWFSLTVDGKFNMNTVVTVNRPSGFDNTQGLSAKLYNAQGTLITSQFSNNSNSVSFVLSDLSAGNYFIEVTYPRFCQITILPNLTISQKAQLSKPTSLKAIVSKRKVTLKWKKCTGAAKYQIFRSTKKSSGYKKIGTTKNTSYVDKNGIKSKKTYYYKIRAKSGNVVSKYSSVVKAKVK